MIAGILQPGYLPWLGFFEQLYRVDVFVLLDDVPYDKHGWRNRNRIKTSQGPQWLTIPVEVSLDARPLVKDARIDNRTDWRRKHWRSLLQNYGKAPHFRRCAPLLEDAYNREWTCIADIDEHLIRGLAQILGIERRIVRSSELGVPAGRTERLIAICRMLGADTFYEGAAGRGYIDVDHFLAHGITVRFQEYRHPAYVQLHGDFVSHLSVVDLLFNCGSDSLSILLSNQEQAHA